MSPQIITGVPMFSICAKIKIKITLNKNLENIFILKKGPKGSM
jgi:hypothetical protein